MKLPIQLVTKKKSKYNPEITNKQLDIQLDANKKNKCNTNIRNKELPALIFSALMAVILVVSKEALAFLPSVELVSILITVSAISYGKRVFYSIYIFVLLEGLLYGFGEWFFFYLYIWAILAIICLIFKNIDNVWVWATINGLFGFFFGLLYSVMYLFMGGGSLFFAKWISGIPFDIIHCSSNFLVALVLYKPLKRILPNFN